MNTGSDCAAELSVEHTGHVARVVMHRPPDNYFDAGLIESLASAFERLDAAPQCRVIVLASEGRSFCAGGNLFDASGSSPEILAADATENPLYAAAVRLFRIGTPVVAEIQGAAIGGGLGLALTADFRLAAPAARFSANFVKLGIHPGFGLSHTLPRLIGPQKAQLMLLTGRRIKPETALAWGLVDAVVERDALTAAARELAEEIAEAAPLAVRATRATQRAGLADAVLAATQVEFQEQVRLASTADFSEGRNAVAQRRPGRFTGR